MIILIDNYDSFTYNLYQYIGEIDNNIEVYRNDIITNAKIKELNPTHIVISPGPGHPADAGNCIEIIKDNHRDVPISSKNNTRVFLTDKGRIFSRKACWSMICKYSKISIPNKNIVITDNKDGSQTISIT